MSEIGFKLTSQRAIILEHLKDNYSHPSVDEIYFFVKKNLPRISKKTVYSNLTFLCDKGLIQEVKAKGVQRYEPKQALHHHLICRICGSIADSRSEELLSQATKIARKIKSFQTESISINFYGVCKKCKEENKNGRRK